MFKKLIVLTTFLGLGVMALMVRMPNVQAQVPCLPPTPFATTCVPVERVVTICPDQLVPFINPQLAFAYSHGMPVTFYGATYFWAPTYPVAYYYGTGFQLELTVLDGTITKVRQLTDRPCATPTAVPAPIVTPVVITRIVEVPVKAGIAPPKTGDAGLLTEN